MADPRDTELRLLPPDGLSEEERAARSRILPPVMEVEKEESVYQFGIGELIASTTMIALSLGAARWLNPFVHYFLLLVLFFVTNFNNWQLSPRRLLWLRITVAACFLIAVAQLVAKFGLF